MSNLTVAREYKQWEQFWIQEESIDNRKRRATRKNVWLIFLDIFNAGYRQTVV